MIFIHLANILDSPKAVEALQPHSVGFRRADDHFREWSVGRAQPGEHRRSLLKVNQILKTEIV